MSLGKTKIPHGIRAVKQQKAFCNFSLRRHYPYQVKGFGASTVSAIKAPPNMCDILFFDLLYHKTPRLSRQNYQKNA